MVQTRRFLFPFLAIALAIAAIPAWRPAGAVGFKTWSGGGGNGLWSDINNWTNFQMPEDGDFVTLGFAPVSYTHLTLPTKRIV